MYALYGLTAEEIAVVEGRDTANIVGANAYNVLYLDGATNGPITVTTVIDGFIITGGNANGSNWRNRAGGGLHCQGDYGSGNECSPTLANLTFSGNAATGWGGGMYSGGYDNGKSNPTLTKVAFWGNSAGATSGGGMFNDGGGSGGASNPTLINCILWGNTATTGPQIYNANATPTVTYSNIQWPSGTYTGTGNLNADPQFVAPIAASSAPTTTGDYRLQQHSPAIDAGDPNPVACPAHDLNGHPRDDLRCDMGAYERVYGDGPTVVKSGFAGGTPYSFGPTWVSMTLATANTGIITVTKNLTYPGGTYDTGEVQATWWITGDLTAGFSITLSLCYTDAEVAGLSKNDLDIFRWVSGQWMRQNATAEPANNCVTLSGVQGFSAWTLKDTSVGAETPTAIRLQGATHLGSALPLGGLALLTLGGAAVRRRRR